LRHILKILNTNWIHLFGFLIAAYLGGIFFKLIGVESEQNWSEVFFDNILLIPFSILIYGIPILIGFYLIIIILDFLIFYFTGINTTKVVLIEWILIVTPFLYWAFKYEFWIWLPLSLSLLITQVLRVKWINRFREIKPKVAL
jgi:hypothetical protein|tara:strand:+ start:1439 stop:1867 length:429 start_codon:yes stop_codon:yes gene_type:complete